MESQLNNRIKQFIPPLLLNYVKDFRNYYDFLKHSYLVKTNINLKNKHKGEKCFILGSGPSINDEDLKPLKNVKNLKLCVKINKQHWWSRCLESAFILEI